MIEIGAPVKRGGACYIMPQKLGMKTDELLLRSIDALERALTVDGAKKRANSRKRTGEPSVSPGPILSPGDKNEAEPATAANTVGGRRIVPKAQTAKNKVAPKSQGKLEF